MVVTSAMNAICTSTGVIMTFFKVVAVDDFCLVVAANTFLVVVEFYLYGDQVDSLGGFSTQ